MNTANSPCLPILLLATLAMAVLPSPNAIAQTQLAHIEYECRLDNGWPHSINTATEANFRLSVYPNSADFGTYPSGETVDVTMSREKFLVDYRASGSLTVPFPVSVPAYLGWY